MPIEQDLKNLIADAGGTVTEIGGPLPDGSGFMTASFPLRKDHWLYQKADDGFSRPPPMPFRMGADDPRRQQFNDAVRAAAKYAIRASTMHGAEVDFDPDAMVQNFVVGMLGYHTDDGLSEDAWANPDPVPPAYPGNSNI